jgi:Calx-beta domain
MSLSRYLSPQLTALLLLALSACGGGGAAVTSGSSGTQSTAPPVSPQDTVQFSQATYAVAQSPGTVSISVTRLNGSSGAASVVYATSSGTAVAGQDFTATSGTLSWSDGDAAAKSIPVMLNTTAFTGTKSFTLTLSSASGAQLGSPSSATVSINGSGATAPPSNPIQQDDVQLSAMTYTVAQTAGSISVNVTRVQGSSGAASVAYATANGTAIAGQNYTAASGTLSWSDGDAAAKSFTVSLSATPFNGAKTFSVSLSKATGILLGSPSTAIVTVNGSAAPPPTAGNGPAAKLAAKLGLPSRLLLGLSDAVADVQAQGLKIDIYTQYLGSGDWTSWNSPPCDYVCVVAQKAAALNAVPMYVQYQMANNGDGNLAVLNDSSFMATYWSRLKLLYQDIAASGKPALINLEPDFWGYVERQGPASDPASMAAIVNSNPDCATLTNDAKGVAGCMIAMARKYAPKAYIGFPPSDWGGNSTADVVAFMNSIGAAGADFIIQQTLDRDAGCYEVSPQPSECARTVTGAYWDETNQTHPNFQDHLTETQAFHTGIGNLPVIWWQTPMGVPSSTPGGTPSHYRDNRVHYFLTHPDQLTAAGGLGVAFAGGAANQTSIKTDSGQFQSLSGSYLASPAALP